MSLRDSQRITFRREIVVCVVHEGLIVLPRRFAVDETAIGLCEYQMYEGHSAPGTAPHDVITVRCLGVDNDKPEPFTFNGNFVLANIPLAAVVVQDL